ncbi:hypothetical protein [Xanthomonas euvesicatoria]|uniref:hypothetical protein n=1 Tax=Xanthomonas euvesicatoria TaxID=456327 RepID=UPI001C483B07|nr:hypothetical protein [Xanthomonas euvesicatoria]MBV6896613.1 hypothetical protein [Xanthomonas campestris pv. ionidii]
MPQLRCSLSLHLARQRWRGQVRCTPLPLFYLSHAIDPLRVAKAQQIHAALHSSVRWRRGGLAADGRMALHWQAFGLWPRAMHGSLALGLIDRQWMSPGFGGGACTYFRNASKQTQQPAISAFLDRKHSDVCVIGLLETICDVCRSFLVYRGEQHTKV